MNPLTIPRHPGTYRFPLPNDIWVQKLKPQAFAILAYLQYRSCRKIHGVPAIRELAMRTKMSVKMAELQVDILVDRGLMTSNLLPTWTPTTAGNFFTLPDEVFYLNLSHGAITVYAYLLCCEDRRSHQCHPSYSTIAETTGLSVNTVMKHITTISDKQLITVERTSYIDWHGMKQNGNNLYTILPIQQATDAFYPQQLDRLESPGEHQRVTEEAPT
mgnify:FL=1